MNTQFMKASKARCMVSSGISKALLDILVNFDEMQNTLVGMKPPSAMYSNNSDSDIDCGLAADFEGSLSGLGVDLPNLPNGMNTISESFLSSLPYVKPDMFVPMFQYVLIAATSPVTKYNEETLTYLNQGQSYEMKMKHNGDSMNSSNLLYRSIIRVVFHERRLQYSEREQLDSWRQTRPGERIIDIDIPLSYGLVDVKIEPQFLNCVEFVWDPTRDTGIFIKVHCISTEFTARKHGGEKGVPFRLQVETYLIGVDEPRLVHCASCQVKVFKPKGADRKHKRDREKIDSCSLSEKERYQPSYDYTVLTEIALEQVLVYLEQLKKHRIEMEMQKRDLEQQQQQQQQNHHNPQQHHQQQQQNHHNQQHQHQQQQHEKQHQMSSKCNLQMNSVDVPIAIACVERSRSIPNDDMLTLSNIPLIQEQGIPSETLMMRGLFHNNLPTLSQYHSLEPMLTNAILPTFTSQQVTSWLNTQRFGNYVRLFQNFAGADLLRLSRDDLIEICGLADGIRLNNALQAKNVRPKLTIYIAQEQTNGKPAYHYLDGGGGLKKSLSWNLDAFLLSSDNYRSVSPEMNAQGTCYHGARREMMDARDVTLCRTVSMGNFMSSPVQMQRTNEQRRHYRLQPHIATSKRQFVGSDDDDIFDEMATVKKQCTHNPESPSKEVYHAVYLEFATCQQLTQRISALYNIQFAQVTQIHIEGPSGIHIMVTDAVVQNIVDHSRYTIRIMQDDISPQHFQVVLKLVNYNPISSS